MIQDMHEKKIERAILSLHARVLPDGGFVELPKAMYRVDATAWAIIALTLAGDPDENALAAARSRLAASQLKDGRVAITQEYPLAFWPTALAVLAWQGSAAQRNAHALAISFLLDTTGKHFKKTPDSPVADDPSIKAWPWIENTSSWVEPTALALLALRTAGYERHPRTREAVRMLLNRQLPHGGWNYGNTLVYGQELYPQPGSTGTALAALAGQADRAEVRKSLDYLRDQAERCRSPFSLCWALLGLSAWGEKPAQSRAWIIESLDLQRRYGVYGTSLLSLLIASFFVDGDISTSLESSGARK
jgi:hypothetical protein